MSESTRIAERCLLLTENNGKENHAGSKARNDADVIFARFGFRKLVNPAINNNVSAGQAKGVSYYLQRAINSGRGYLALKDVKGEVIFAQFPDYSPNLIHNTIKNLFMSNKMVFLVHDVDALRNFGGQNDELEILKRAQILICHNEAMICRLKELGVMEPKFIDLGMFDYLVPAKQARKAFAKAVNFAGNLGKSQFLLPWLELNRQYDINLYGIGLDENKQLPGHTFYKGSFIPEELPAQMSGGFGLVWDGDSIATGHGPMGEYTRYNSPHKFSLYVAAGMPVLVWKQAAVAKIVEKYQIGYCIDSLEDIEKLLVNTTQDQYDGFVNHLADLQSKVLKGYFLETATRKALQEL